LEGSSYDIIFGTVMVLPLQVLKKPQNPE